MKLTEFNRNDRLKEECKMDAIMQGLDRFFCRKSNKAIAVEECAQEIQEKPKMSKECLEKEHMKMRRKKRVNCAKRCCENRMIEGSRCANFLSPGETGKVVGIRSNEKIKRHLSNLGFVSGTDIMLVNDSDGNVIFKVKESRIALGKEMACKIIVV